MSLGTARQQHQVGIDAVTGLDREGQVGRELPGQAYVAA